MTIEYSNYINHPSGEDIEKMIKKTMHNKPHKPKKHKHKKKHELMRLQKELDRVKETCVELKRENMILRNKVKRLEHEDKMNQPRRKKYPPFWGAPWYCWGSDAWR